MTRSLKKLKLTTLVRVFENADPAKKVHMIGNFLPDIDNEVQYTSVFEILGAKGIQLTILEALRMAILNDDRRLMGTIISKILPSMKEISGNVSHSHTLGMAAKQLDGMSDDEMRQVVSGEARKRKQGKLPVPADYEILEKGT